MATCSACNGRSSLITFTRTSCRAAISTMGVLECLMASAFALATSSLVYAMCCADRVHADILSAGKNRELNNSRSSSVGSFCRSLLSALYHSSSSLSRFCDCSVQTYVIDSHSCRPLRSDSCVMLAILVERAVDDTGFSWPESPAMITSRPPNCSSLQCGQIFCKR